MRRPGACQNADASSDIRELETRSQQLTQRVEQLGELFRLAQLKRFAPSSEKLKDRVFDEAEEVALAEPVEDDPDGVFALPDTGLPAVDGSGHQKRGRKPLPADLPRTRIEYDLPEDQKVCPCCQGAMHRMGEQTCEQLHIQVKASELQHVRFKYACRHRERHAEHTPILIAPMPAQPLPGSNASAAMIATVMSAKYADGTPLYRMEDALGRSNIAVSRGTLAHWIIRPAELHLSRLYEALRGTLLAQSLIHGDETTVQVLKEDGKSAQSKSYMWVYRSAEASAEPVVLFEYQPGRGQQYVRLCLTRSTIKLSCQIPAVHGQFSATIQNRVGKGRSLRLVRSSTKPTFDRAPSRMTAVREVALMYRARPQSLGERPGRRPAPHVRHAGPGLNVGDRPRRGPQSRRLKISSRSTSSSTTSRFSELSMWSR
jgi:transposase